MLSYRYVLASLAPAFVVFACSASGEGGDPVTESDGGPTDPAPTIRLPPPSQSDDAGEEEPTDASADAAKDGGKKDGSVEAGIDAGPPAPETGEPCSKFDAIFKRSCGVCGTQEAICEKDDAGVGRVTMYSPCTGELVNGCLPGTTEPEACGNCGTRTRTCTKFCAWQTTACVGEPANSCIPFAHDYTPAGCGKDTYRTRDCSAQCTWTYFSPTCNALSFTLTAPTVVGQTSSGIFPLRAVIAGKKISGTCGASAYLSSTVKHPQAYVTLVNPSSSTLVLSAWNTKASPTAPILDTLMTVYASGTKPTTDAERKACTGSVADYCPATTPCGDTRWAGLFKGVTLPPNGSAWLWFGSYYEAGGATAAEGDVQLVLRAESVQ